jgi:hypothetical protein
MKTERMTVLVTPEQKAAILARAQSLGLSAGEVVRRAVESYDPLARGVEEDEAVLSMLADELLAAAKSARAALNDANNEVQSTLKQLARSRKAAYGRV